jgi:hypothetical protein
LTHVPSNILPLMGAAGVNNSTLAIRSLLARGSKHPRKWMYPTRQS